MVQIMILGKKIHEWHMIAKIHQINGNEKCKNLFELMAWWDNFCYSGPENMAKHFYAYYIYDGNLDTSWIGKEVQRLLQQEAY